MLQPTSEQSVQSNRFYCEVMKPLESAESPQRLRVVGRSSISSIPPPDPALIYTLKRESDTKSDGSASKKSETLSDALCNSYKFVVNYGVFEANFEWLPCEVNIAEVWHD